MVARRNLPSPGGGLWGLSMGGPSRWWREPVTEDSARSVWARRGGPLTSSLSLHKAHYPSFPWGVFGFSQQSNELHAVLLVQLSWYMRERAKEKIDTWCCVSCFLGNLSPAWFRAGYHCLHPSPWSYLRLPWENLSIWGRGQCPLFISRNYDRAKQKPHIFSLSIYSIWNKTYHIAGAP